MERMIERMAILTADTGLIPVSPTGMFSLRTLRRGVVQLIGWRRKINIVMSENNSRNKQESNSLIMSSSLENWMLQLWAGPRLEAPSYF
jgi:hypothetical protein